MASIIPSISSLLEGPRLLRVGIAALISLALAFHGLAKKSLNVSGAVAAVFVGFSSLACGYRFGLILILFYYTSSKFTKVQEDKKKRLEFEYASGGQRNWIQVFANSILATLTALYFVFRLGDDEIALPASVIHPKIRNLSDFSSALNNMNGDSLALYLSCIYVAHYACAAADTWASEIGILNKGKPRLITSFFLRAVPPGTNGGVSPLGILASCLGGAFIGSVYAVYDVILLKSPWSVANRMIVFGVLCGLSGSLLDSLLGATLQATYYSTSKKCIVKEKEELKRVEDAKLICGVDVLSNDAVNVISIFMTMLMTFVFVPLVFN